MRRILFVLTMLMFPCAVWAETMTYRQAVERIPPRQLPDFWVGDVDGLAARWEKVQKGQVRTFAISPGGRPLHLITYGQREDIPRRANFNSAVGARKPSAYLDKSKRQRPVLFFIGPVHGHEVEGLTGLVNLVTIMETGKDLRGRDQLVLRELGEKCRLLIVPAGNPDGIARFEPRALQSMNNIDLRFWGQGTWNDDTLCGWPDVKQLHPMIGERVGFLGCYFNDAGINPMHDEFFAPMSSEAPTILMIAQEEGPDRAVSLHSHESAPAILRPAYVPLEIQQDVRSLAEDYYSLLDKRKLPHQKPFTVKSESLTSPAPFNLTSALYHISGAAPFTFECPHGLVESRACQVNLEQILDIQLALYEAMMRYELNKKK